MAMEKEIILVVILGMRAVEQIVLDMKVVEEIVRDMKETIVVAPLIEIAKIEADLTVVEAEMTTMIINLMNETTTGLIVIVLVVVNVTSITTIVEDLWLVTIVKEKDICLEIVPSQGNLEKVDTKADAAALIETIIMILTTSAHLMKRKIVMVVAKEAAAEEVETAMAVLITLEKKFFLSIN
jgi:hypothetical protein